MYVVQKDYNWIHDLITGLIQRHKPTVLDQTKRAEHHAKGKSVGLMEGVCLALTNYGTSVRLGRLPDLPVKEGGPKLADYFPAVEYHTVHKLIKQMLEDWDGDLWKEQSDEKFFEWFDGEYNKIIDEVLPDFEMKRRALVRSGDMEPQAGDEGWLAQEAADMVEAANPLMDLAKKAAAAAASSEA